MEPILCINCFAFFPPSPKHKNQSYCMKPECRRAKKAAWKRTKMKSDPQFKEDQRLSYQKCARNNPDYWREYRRNNPKKAERNRMLQSVRNRRRRNKPRMDSFSDDFLIAKVDASNALNCNTVGCFWLVPVIAKVDALKVNIYKIPGPYR